MKRLLAKLPRSSSGSRAASASSSASRWPFVIFDVSITAAAGFSIFALVSSAICFSGASSGDFMFQMVGRDRRARRLSFDGRLGEPVPTKLWFIKFRSIAGVLLQNLARRKFLLTLRQPFQLIDDFFQPKMLSEPQGSTSEWC